MAGRIQRYTRIKNDVLELLARGVLSYRQTRIALVIIRESWGWNAGRSNWTHRPLTVTEIAKRAGINRRDVAREIRAMIERNILQIKDQEMGIQYSFNEHENTWQMTYGRGKTPQGGRGKTPRGGVKHPGGEGQNTPGEGGKTPRGAALKFKSPKGSGDRKERSKEKDLKEKDLNASRRTTRTYSDAAKRIVARVKAKMIERGATAFERDWHLKQLAVAESLLKTVTETDINTCMDWAFEDQHWGDKVDGMATIQRVMKQWQMRSRGSLKSAGAKDPDDILGEFFNEPQDTIDVEAQVIDGD